jgi:hypothetical protein
MQTIRGLMPSTPKRYGWFRHRNGLVQDPRWQLVERRCGVPRAAVATIVCYLLELANQAHPRRGSVEDFGADLCAVALGIPVADVRKVRHELEVIDVGFIDQDFVVDWVDIQREKEDATSTERSQKHRARKKAAREEEKRRLLGVARNGVAGVAATDATPLHAEAAEPAGKLIEIGVARNGVAGVTATPKTRPDQISWLFGEGGKPGAGVECLCQLGGINSADVAGTVLRRWLTRVSAEVLITTLMRVAEQAEIDAAGFKDAVEGLIAEAERRATGQGNLMLPIDGARSA